MQYDATGIAKYIECLYAAMRGTDLPIKIKFYNSKLPKLLNASNHGKFVKLYNFLMLHFCFPIYLFFAPRGILHLPWNGNGPWYIIKKHRVISTIHDVLPCIMPGYFNSVSEYRKYRKKILVSLRRSDLVMTDSTYSKDSINEYFNFKKSCVISLASTLSTHEIINKKYEMHDLGPYYVYVGGYDKRKGLDELLRAHELYTKSTVDPVKLVMIGKVNFYSESFREQYNNMKNAGLLLEAGYVSDNELITLYTNARALVYPSRYEGFGLPPLEAMGLGCPVLTTHQTSLKELCYGATLELPDVNDTTDFAERIEQIVHNEKLRAQLREKGAIRAEQYTWKKSAENFSKCLNAVCNYDYN